jgi:tyrosinase
MPPANPRVRRDIWSLENERPWHPILRAYALAIGDMQRRPVDDPTSWRYQAQIHGMPGSVQPDRFRGQCQHRGWFFLPWHRQYLGWFEQIVLAAVRARPDVDDATKDAWALPYWDYSLGEDRRKLPPPFLEPTLPDTTTANPLFVGQRAAFINDGDPLDELIARADKAMEPAVFSEPAPSGGFGGAATGFNHTAQDPNRAKGMLEKSPHDSVHSAIGGFMGDFATAGRDPVFWCHHANIDRLWVVWLGQTTGPPRDNPDPTGPWGTTKAHFHGPDGTTDHVSTAAGALDTAAGLGYVYEDTSLPPVIPRPQLRPFPLASQPPPEHPAELVGATDEAVALRGATERVTLPVAEPRGPARGFAAGGPERTFLALEGIEGERDPGVVYAVYVDLPDDADPDDAPESFFAGTLSFFGLAESRQVDADPGGHPVEYSYDISDLVADLVQEGAWDPAAVSVTFVPLQRAGRRGSAAELQHSDVTVGRVGIYVQ